MFIPLYCAIMIHNVFLFIVDVDAFSVLIENKSCTVVLVAQQ